MTSLASSFRSGNPRKAKWQGKTVFSVFDLPVSDGDTIKITRMSASKTRAQALKVAIDKGDLRANGVLMTTAAIWTHTAPDEASLTVVGKRARSVDVWNSWSYEGVDSCWLGNAAMIVEQDGDAHILKCSDGVGSARFDDLVVRIEVGKHG